MVRHQLHHWSVSKLTQQDLDSTLTEHFLKLTVTAFYSIRSFLARPAVWTAVALLSCAPSAKPFDPAPDPSEQTSRPSPALARLLTHLEYQRTVEDLLDTHLNVVADFPPEPVVFGFSNNAQSYQMTPLLMEQQRKAATALAEEARERGFEALGICSSNDEQECADEVIEKFGRRAFRRPLDQDELSSLKSLYLRAKTGLGHDAALAAVVEAYLTSPQFLYRIEAPAVDSTEDAILLGPFELSSRLSYFLTGSMPDEELLTAAENGELFDLVAVEQQARRLLASPRARERIREFHGQWLGLDRLASISRDGAVEGSNESLRESIDQFLDNIFWSETSSVNDLYSSSAIYVDERLASMYNLEPSASMWLAVSVPAERAGLLTQPALLSLLAHPDQSAPVKRGVFIRETILCQEVAAPPPTVNNTPPDPDPSLTTRERFAVHTEDAVCAECHSLIDPVGFAFEAYDQLGRYRTAENGIPIDESGALLGFPEATLNSPVSTGLELATRVSESDTALNCLAEKWLIFALGRGMSADDQPALSQAVEHAQRLGGSMQELLIALSLSDVFLKRAAHDLDGAAP